MIFSIAGKKQLTAFHSNWHPKELELEDYLISTAADGEGEAQLSQDIFGEPLLFVGNQKRTRNQKRADILAVDQSGNGVIVELKRYQGNLGVDTQALQYVADFSAYKGQDFIDRFGCDDPQGLRDRIESFLGAEADIDELNKDSRVILMARSFDPTLYSMGEWLSSLGVAFRCIEYTPFQVGKERFLSFSIAFDRSPRPLYRLRFQSTARELGIYWHNIGVPSEEWWTYLKTKGQIPACFLGQPGDQGEQLLRGYTKGDTVIAYAKGYGAVGWGVVRSPGSTYELVRRGSRDDKLEGEYLHRLGIDWKTIAPRLEDGIRPAVVRKEFGIYHPIPTAVSIPEKKARELIQALDEKFGRDNQA